MEHRTRFQIALVVVVISLLILSFTQTVAQSPSMSVDPNPVKSGQSITVHWWDLAATGNDWISLHPSGADNGTYFEWQYATGNAGSVTFYIGYDPGWYDFRLFRNGEHVATVTFEVVDSQEIYPTDVPPNDPPVPSLNPNVTLPSISPSGDCRWDVWFYLSGFAPNSNIAVSSNYSAVNCAGQASGSPWSGYAGTTDGGGNLWYGVVHQDTGTYTYTFTDDQGNTAAITFTTSVDNPIPVSPDETLVPGENPIGATPTSVFPDDCSQSPGNDFSVDSFAYVSSDAGSANLRSRPTTSAGVIQSLPNNTEVSIVDGSVCADTYWWWKIDVGGMQGWVAGHLLEIGEATPGISTTVPTSIPVQPAPTSLPPFATAQSGEGIHWGIYCSQKYGAGEYHNGNDPRTWGCGGQALEHNTVCQEVWGLSRPYAHYGNVTELGSLTCQATPQGQPGGLAPLFPEAQTNDGGIHTISYCQRKGWDTAQHSDTGADVAYSHRCVKDQSVWYFDWDTACREVYGYGWYAQLGNADQVGGWKCAQDPNAYKDPTDGIDPRAATSTPIPTPTLSPVATAATGVLPVVGYANAPSGAWVQVVTGRINVRSGPDVSYDAIAQAPQGAYFNLLGSDPATGWYNVSWGSGTGWVSNETQYTLASGISQETIEQHIYSTKASETHVDVNFPTISQKDISFHLACAIFSVPLDIKKDMKSRFVTFETYNGILFEAGPHLEGEGIKAGYGLIPTEGYYLYMDCIKTTDLGKYVALYGIDYMIGETIRMRDPNNWTLTVVRN